MTLSPAVRQILLTPNYVRRWGLVEHWRLDEASGIALPAYGGNALTDNNTVTSAAGLVHPLARQFTAANGEYLSIASNAALQTGDVDWWTAAWVYLDSLGVLRMVVCKHTNSINREWALFLPTNNKPQFTVWDGVTAATIGNVQHTSAISVSTWVFLAAYHDAIGNQVGISMDGGAFQTAATTGTTTAGDRAFHIGARSVTPDQLMDGRITSVSFGKSPPNGIAAVANEIRDRLYNGGRGRSFPWR